MGLKLALPSQEEYRKFIDFDRYPPTLLARDSSISEPRALLCEAVSDGNIGAVRSFLDLGIDPDSFDLHGYRLLHLAIFNSQNEMARFLLRRGADPSLAMVCDPRATPVYCAAISTENELVRDLVTAGANVQQPGLIHAVARHCDRETVEHVIAYGADIFEINPQTGANVLHSAAKSEHWPVVDLLLSCGLKDEINATNNNGKTPLLKALTYVNEESALTLLDAGADVNVVDPTTGNQPLHLAAYSGMKYATPMILEKGAHIDAVGWNARTALQMAASGPSAEVVELLIDHGADLDHTDNAGQTALHIAATDDNGDQVPIVKALLRAGIDVDVRDALNMTALEVARDMGFLHVAYMIETEDPFAFDWLPPGGIPGNRSATWDEFLRRRYGV
ncbi:hypothetical protein VTN96DRAFT_2286 [Rasamsonia emersonii]